MSSVLVTGAGGFIGRGVAARLIHSGHSVLGIGRGEPPKGLRLAGWNGAGVDVANLSKFAAGVRTIYHCAGSGSVARSIENPTLDFDSNVLTTQTVLEFARRQRETNVVLLSSAGVYGAAATMPLRSDAPLNPVSPYGYNKEITELLAKQYSHCFAVPTTTIRLFSVYGEGLRKQLLWDAALKLSRGQATFFGTGLETRDWIHIDDAVDLIITAGGLAGSCPQILNGGVGRAIPIRKVVKALADRLGYQGEIVFSGEVRVGDPTHYQADVSEALLTGWRPMVEFYDGLDRYVNWFKRASIASV